MKYVNLMDRSEKRIWRETRTDLLGIPERKQKKRQQSLKALNWNDRDKRERQIQKRN
jgi:hypothetical protein